MSDSTSPAKYNGKKILEAINWNEIPDDKDLEVWERLTGKCPARGLPNNKNGHPIEDGQKGALRDYCRAPVMMSVKFLIPSPKNPTRFEKKSEIISIMVEPFGC